MFAWVALVAACAGAFGDQPVPKIIVGKDTTRVDGPVLPDGTIDYAAAQLKQITGGLTEENNGWAIFAAAFALWKEAEGPDDVVLDHSDKATMKPWKDADFPDIAAMLKANEKALALIGEASRKSRMMIPMQVNKDNVLVRAPGLGNLRIAARTLAARAMNEIAEGKQDLAREDVATIHRLARQQMNEPITINEMVGQGIDATAWVVVRAGAQAGAPKDIQNWFNQSMGLEELRMNPSAIDMNERYLALNRVMLVMRGHADSVLSDLTMMNLESMFLTSKTGATVNPGDLDQVDWNIALRRINAKCDEVVAILGQENAAKRRAAWDAFITELEKEPVPGNFFDAMGGSLLDKEKGDYEAQKKQMLADVAAYLKMGKGESQADYSERIARYFTYELKSDRDIDNLMIRGRAEQRLNMLALGLMILRDRDGAYPDTLDKVKDVIPRLPTDPFSDEAFIYVKSGKGFKIYSVGPNGKDDGGVKETSDHVRTDGIIVEMAK